MQVESVANPKPIDLYHLVYEYAPKLANGMTVLPAPDPWFKALVLALEEQLNAAHAQQEARIATLEREKEDMLDYMNRMQDRLHRLLYAGQDE